MCDKDKDELINSLKKFPESIIPIQNDLWKKDITLIDSHMDTMFSLINNVTDKIDSMDYQKIVCVVPQAELSCKELQQISDANSSGNKEVLKIISIAEKIADNIDKNKGVIKKLNTVLQNKIDLFVKNCGGNIDDVNRIRNVVKKLSKVANYAVNYDASDVVNTVTENSIPFGIGTGVLLVMSCICICVLVLILVL